MKYGFTVRFARVTQDHSQNPGTTSVTLGIHHPSTGAKINLGFLPRLHLDPLDGLWAGLTKAAHEAFDRLIGTGELNLNQLEWEIYELWIHTEGHATGRSPVPCLCVLLR